MLPTSSDKADQSVGVTIWEITGAPMWQKGVITDSLI